MDITDLSPEDLKLLDNARYIINRKDLEVFEMLPLDSQQKADFLRFLVETYKDDKKSKKPQIDDNKIENKKSEPQFSNLKDIKTKK